MFFRRSLFNGVNKVLSFGKSSRAQNSWRLATASTAALAGLVALRWNHTPRVLCQSDSETAGNAAYIAQRACGTDYGLTKKVVLVTGASSGIGKAAAIEFARHGAVVVVTGRDGEALKGVETAVQQLGGTCMAVTGDLTNENTATDIVAGVLQRFGRLDVVVNSAGVLKGGSVQSATLENFDFNFNINTRAVFMMYKAVIPHLEKTKGAIINVSSVNGLQSFGGVLSYCASKAAVDQMTRCAAVDLAPMGIRVNSVNPGVTRSELQLRGGLTPATYKGFLERSKITHPIGRIAEAEEVAAMIVFLASNNKAGMVTGACIPIDGGRSCLGAR